MTNAFRRNLEIVLYKTYADLRAEAERSYLSFVWWILEPLLYLGAFYVLFVVIFQRGGPEFVPFFLCGAIVWKWFDAGLKGGGNSIIAHGGLIQQVYVPKFVFPIIAVLGATARFLPVLLLFLVFLVWYGVGAKGAWAALPLLIVVQLCLTVALAMLVASITPFLPDLRLAVDNGLIVVFFVSGVLFDINDVHEPARTLLFLNPMAVLIDEYREVLIAGNWPDAWRVGAVLAFSAASAALALLVLTRFDRRYSKLRF